MGAVPTTAATTSERECTIGRSRRGRAPEQGLRRVRTDGSRCRLRPQQQSFIPSTVPPRPRHWLAPSAGGPGRRMQRWRRTQLWAGAGAGRALEPGRREQGFFPTDRGLFLLIFVAREPGRMGERDGRTY
jgi:hypothetical protein